MERGGSAPKIKKFTFQNVGYIEMREGGLDFQIFPKFKWPKYGLDLVDICFQIFPKFKLIYIILKEGMREGVG